MLSSSSLLSVPCIHVPSSGQQASAVQRFRLVDPIHLVAPKCISPCVQVVWGEGADLSRSLVIPQRLGDIAGSHIHAIALAAI